MAWLRMAFTLVRNLFRDRGELALENLALRQQLAVYQHKNKRPRIRNGDRIFWVWLSKIWKDWRSVLVIVQPATVIRWHKQGFRLYWRWKSRPKTVGRPRVEIEIRKLIERAFVLDFRRQIARVTFRRLEKQLPVVNICRWTR